ncbi:hypothetical protein Bca4012_086132 [Brassica carinata]
MDNNSKTHYKEEPSHRRENSIRRPQNGYGSHLSGNHSYVPSRHRNSQYANRQKGLSSQRQEWHPREFHPRDPSKESSRRGNESFRGDSHLDTSLEKRHELTYRDRDEDMRTPSQHRSSPQEISSASRNKKLPSARGDPLQKCNSNIQTAAFASALGAIKETMIQYTSCIDPSESAARKERLRQAEANGILERNAVRMVRSSIAREYNETNPLELEVGEHNSQERRQERTVSARLGPINENPSPQEGTQERIPVSERLGPLSARTSSRDRSPAATRLGSLYGDSAEKDAEKGRLPAIARLGPLILHDEEGPSEPPANPLVVKRKPGRPPGIQRAQTNTEQAPITTSRKRKAPQDKPPTGKKKSGAETVKVRKKSDFCNQFHQTYFMQIEQEIIAVLTDTFHKPEFEWHVMVLQRLFSLVESGSLTEPLWDASTVPHQYPNNADYVCECTIKLLSSAFPNIMVQEENKDLYGEEAAAKLLRERQRMLLVLGLIAPKMTDS